MLFTELSRAIHPHLMKDADVPTFMRNLIQMLCDIPEDDWYSKRDPSSDEKYKDGSLRKFYSKGLSKKLSKAMLARLDKNNFIDSINGDNRSDVVISGLIDDVRPFCNAQNIDANNVGDILFDLFHKSLEFIVNPELENDRKIERASTISSTAKGSFGSGLLDDCKFTCSISCCGKHLQTVDSQNKTVSNYEIIRIEDNKPSKYDNLIAVCHDCFQAYVLKHTATERNNLKTMKKLQSDSRSSRLTLAKIDISEGIALVIENLSKANPKELQELSYNPVTVSEKIDEEASLFLYQEVKQNVILYYSFIDSTMKNLARNNTYSDDFVRAQIKEAYKKLSTKKMSNEKIYAELSKQIQRITKQDIRFCYIVVSYFVQSCEVFNAITK